MKTPTIVICILIAFLGNYSRSSFHPQHIPFAPLYDDPSEVARQKTADSLASLLYHSHLTDGNDDEQTTDLTGTFCCDLDDSTVLTLIYGNCRLTDNTYEVGLLTAVKEPVYAFRKAGMGFGYYGETDSSDMVVADRFEINDSTVVIYTGGWAFETDVSHNGYNESALIVIKCNDGWRVSDWYKDEMEIDFHERNFCGTYGGMSLFSVSSFGIYAGGVSSSDISYDLIVNGRFGEGHWAYFNLGRSNEGSMQCMSDDTINCGCYSGGGQVNYFYNDSLGAFVFNYNDTEATSTCNETMPLGSVITNETYYLNSHSSFPGYSETGTPDKMEITCNYSPGKISKLLREGYVFH